MADFNVSDLEYILTQIKMAETGQAPDSPHLAFGLREVAGTNNSTVPGQAAFGSADQTFLHLGDQVFQTADVKPGTTTPTSYLSTGATSRVYDAAPRTISNLISDQTANNPAALAAQAKAFSFLGAGYQHEVPNPAYNALTNPNVPQFILSNATTPTNVDAAGNLFINNVTPDNGLSAPSNEWFTFFGQFFDHGLDLVNKGGSGKVLITLQPDDPLYVPGGHSNFMTLTRATMVNGHDATNAITPFVDQSQTYASHPSHQVFLREYIMGVDGKLHSTGKLLTSATGGMATWADVKANAATLGIKLNDDDVGKVPLLDTDAYGNVRLGTNGHARIAVEVSDSVTVAGVTTITKTTVFVEAAAGNFTIDLDAPPNPVAPQIDHTYTVTTVGAGTQFLNDIAHNANPFNDFGAPLTADLDNVAGNTIIPNAQGQNTVYDDELLNAHYVAGDGRLNENIGLTAVHEVFHSEHNRLTAETKALVQNELNNGNVSFAQNWVLSGPVPLVAGHQIADNEWNGERLFQAAKFGTETQYQHLVFEEFARKIAPDIHVFGNNDISLDPGIFAEFAHAVYRFGHSMLDEQVARYKLNPDGSPQLDVNGKPIQDSIGLIEAFTNPLAYASHGTSAAAEIIQGSTHQVSNEIDEFVTGALRNNLLGQPLDLAALNIARGRETGVAPLNLLRAQIFSTTHDQGLRPYESWNDFGNYLKHPASLINFVAAYGHHAALDAATTLDMKRAVASAIVSGQSVTLADGTVVNAPVDSYDFMHSTGAYINDAANANAVHATWTTGSITGLDNVDLWIGGLAEKQNLFGGLLGSTFNFVFKLQLEHLQDADRLYYLPRIEGTHWGSEIEGNSFADLITRNTGATHLPGSIFLTPEYTVEAKNIIVRDINGNLQYDVNGNIITTDPATWAHNPVTGAHLVDVLNDGTIRFIGDDNFLGNTMVLGGTQFDDKLEAGHADDDTVYGDAGNDTIDGGGGNDFLFGGTGDDFIHDVVGDNVIHGDQGDDTIIAGRGDDILFGGDGNDYIETGDAGLLGDSAIGGLGNDIIVGGVGADTLEGNEGDDWLEGGANGDTLIGDQGAPTGQQPLIQGNDVLDGGAGGDRMQGFSGDDIMLGQGGFDKFEGRLGFDWASWENNSQGVDVDMNRREFIPNPAAPAGDAVRDFFIATEGASGSRFDDFILGTNDNKVDTFNELTNTNLIFGIDAYFDPLAGPVAFSGGNILLGGAGSDQITGGGGNDIIDGDARLHVALIGGHHAGAPILREIVNDATVATFDPVLLDPNPNHVDPNTLLPLPLQLTAGDIDTAVFRGNLTSGEYVIAQAVDIHGIARFAPDGTAVIQVTHTPLPGTPGALTGVSDGTDLLWNVERAQFADVTIDLNLFFGGASKDAVPGGIVSLFDARIGGGAAVAVAAATVINVGDTLTIAQGTDPTTGAPLFDAITGAALSQVFDLDGVKVNGVVDAATVGNSGENIPIGELNLQWQTFSVAGKDWVNITGATSSSFTPTDALAGQQLRLSTSWIDGLGHKETVFSAPTAVVTFSAAGVNHAPTIATQVASPGLPDTSAMEDRVIANLPLNLTKVFIDDTTPSNLLLYSATLAGTIDGVNVDGHPLSEFGLTFSTIPDLSPTAALGAIVGGRITGTPNFVTLDPVNGSAIVSNGFAGAVNIRVTATDTGGLSVQDTFQINVIPANDGAASLTISGTPTQGQQLSAVFGATPDPDNSPTHPGTAPHFQWLRDGTAVLGKTAAVYNVTASDVGHAITVSADYKDGQGYFEHVTSAATAGVTGLAGNAAPTVNALNGVLNENGTPAPYVKALLTGAIDPNGDPLIITGFDATATSLIGTAAGHTLTLGIDYTIGGNNFAFTPHAYGLFNSLSQGQVETVTFNFNVTDTQLTTPNTLNITVNGVNDAPVVSAPVTIAVTEAGAPVTVDALTNASDADTGPLGSVMSIVNIPATLPAGVTYNPETHAFTFNPSDLAYFNLAGGVHQVVTVNYGITDGIATTLATVAFDVTGVTNTAGGGVVQGLASEGGAIVTLNALANAVGVASVSGVPASPPAGVTFDPLTHTFSLDPTNAAYNSLAVGQHQTVQATYTVTSGTATALTTVAFDITGTNDAPTGAPTAVLANGTEDVPYVVTAASLLQGFSDVDTLDKLSVTNLVSSNGTVAAGPNGTFIVTPGLNYNGPVNLTYAVTDGHGGTIGGQSRSFSLAAVNDAPINLQLSNTSVNENAADNTVVGTLSAIDPDGIAITYSLTNSAESRFILVGNQIQVAHTSLLDFEAESSHVIKVMATDSSGASTSKDITIRVNNLPEAFTINGGPSPITGTAGIDRIHGTAGDDIILALGGNDYIDGGTGADLMNGGAGNDTYVVDNAGDTISESNGNDTVITTLNGFSLDASIINSAILNNGTVENLIHKGSSAFTGFGNGSDNIMKGGTGIDTLSGAGGNDLMLGGAGADTLNGEGGNDTIYGGKGSDTINGGANSDVINGGAGNDILTGGGGIDSFVFNTALVPQNIDLINDYNLAADTIRLDHNIFGNTPIGTLAGIGFHAGAGAAAMAATTADQHILYNSATGALFYDADGSGAGAAVQFATLTSANNGTHAALTNADFIIF